MAVPSDILSPANDLAVGMLNMQLSEMMCDVALVANDRSITKAHKLVLVAVSPYFQNIYQAENTFDTFLFKGASTDTVTSLLQYMYGNVHTISVQNARNIYPFATLLELTHVMKLCEYLDPSVRNISFDVDDLCILPIVHKSDFSPKRKLFGPLSAKRKRMENAMKKVEGSKRRKGTKTSMLEDGKEILSSDDYSEIAENNLDSLSSGNNLSTDRISTEEKEVEFTELVFPKGQKRSRMKTMDKNKEDKSKGTLKISFTATDDSHSNTSETEVTKECNNEQPSNTVYECAICQMMHLTLESVQNHMHQDHLCHRTHEDETKETNSESDDYNMNEPCSNLHVTFTPSDIAREVAQHQEDFSLWKETGFSEKVPYKRTISKKTLSQESSSVKYKGHSAHAETTSATEYVTSSSTVFDCVFCQQSHPTLESIQNHMHQDHGCHQRQQADEICDSNSESDYFNVPELYSNLRLTLTLSDVAKEVAQRQEDFLLWKESTVVKKTGVDEMTPLKTPTNRRSSVENR